jgi:uncharacterized protein
MLIITTNFKPIKGSQGYYRAQMKHGVIEVHVGDRANPREQRSVRLPD